MPYPARCLVYTCLWFLWAVLIGLFVLAGIPDPPGLMRLIAIGILTAFGGWYTYTRDPEGR